MSVLVCYIPTPEGWAALEAATAEATLRHTELVVLNVAVGGDFADVTFADEKDLDAVSAQLDTLGVEHTVVQVLDATDVADTVISEATDRQVELIVVGLRRRSPVGKALLGSSAQHIILAAECPVLSVRSS